MVKNETKFWHEIKKSTPEISWTRIENTSLLCFVLVLAKIKKLYIKGEFIKLYKKNKEKKYKFKYYREKNSLINNNIVKILRTTK